MENWKKGHFLQEHILFLTTTRTEEKNVLGWCRKEGMAMKKQNNLLGLFLSLIVGALFGSVQIGLLLAVFLFPLRRSAGGYHANTVQAGTKAKFDFTLGNTGTKYTRKSSSTNTKTILSDPWTLNVSTISYAGPYGISFCPAQCSGTTITRTCTKSAIWRHAKGYKTIKYGSGDAAMKTYRLLARQDSDYYSIFKSSGWWNADKLNP